jgi:hypothetical protein
MKGFRVLCQAVVGVMLVANTAAADRIMVVLLDATGSMTAPRCDNGNTRFDQAKLDAEQRIQDVATEAPIPGVEEGGLAKVAVYRFAGSGTGLEVITHDPTLNSDFVAPFDAVQAIIATRPPNGATPLANAMCQVVATASQFTTDQVTTPISTRFVEVFSDGGENNSVGPPCAGPYSSTNGAPFENGSWQNLVFLAGANVLPHVRIDPTLYHNETGCLSGPSTIDPEPGALVPRPRATAQATSPATDVDFFSALAVATGGLFTDALDNAPELVTADLDGDFDVDRNDAILLARRFGAPPSPAFDLNADGKIGFADYQLLRTHFSRGRGTPIADPYTQSPTITCTGARAITLDGKVIESGGLTVQGGPTCHLIIRNILIVSGAAAITIRGSAILEVDNSIIVGEAQWLNASGATSLAASRSVFHGPQVVSGSFTLLDRGGNTFEK